MELDSASTRLIELGFVLCLIVLLVFLIIQFRRGGRQDDRRDD